MAEDISFICWEQHTNPLKLLSYWSDLLFLTTQLRNFFSSWAKAVQFLGSIKISHPPTTQAFTCKPLYLPVGNLVLVFAEETRCLDAITLCSVAQTCPWDDVWLLQNSSYWGRSRGFQCQLWGTKSLLNPWYKWLWDTWLINNYHTDATLLMVFLGKLEWRTKYLRNHLLPFQHCVLDTRRAGFALTLWYHVKRLEGAVLLPPKVPLLGAVTLRIGVEISKYGGASESRFCYLNNVERMAWTGRWQACAKTRDVFAIDFAVCHLGSLFYRAASTLAVTLVLLFYFFNFFFFS